jgi:hypothetical protein
MPTISRFFGIKIKMYPREHPPPHFHARYGEAEASFSIETLDLISGGLPRRVRALVLEWAMIHRPELRDNWRRCERRDPLQPVPGLDEEV